ncbi:Alpha-(1,3)-fucosyltransferase C [Mizuhopecten yessoensis]|uniref:Fucosyltransferase n=1 Tax=Mizuhopecten yessoensis TaxID=6573 RepID=A0A210QWD1_MIZYE|nr:Alpha-(1,3)-fucosyltransferase C [Mizuhopecten yessoensis]
MLLYLYEETDLPNFTWDPPNLKQAQENIEAHYYNKPSSVSLQAFSRCPDRCSMTHGKYSYKYKKIVIFHGPDLYWTPPRKYPGQHWIMQAMKPPTYFANNLIYWTRVFNWTFMHRRDSDVFTPYGSYAPIMSKSDKVTTTFDWDAKDMMAAWFVSRCNVQSRRQEYVRLLQRDVSVHIYGTCGDMSCPRSIHHNCLNQLQSHYKFYLAFENRLCADYLTEKVSKLLQDGIDGIPVVRGTGDLYKMHLPPGSYINVHDYTIKGLAQKMQYISQNRTEFEKYFFLAETLLRGENRSVLL